FNPAHATSNTAREFLSQISGIQISQEATDLQKLTLFLEAARKLNTAGVLDEILMTMLDTTLQLTRAERGYVFLKDEQGKLRLAAAAVEVLGVLYVDSRFASRDISGVGHDILHVIATEAASLIENARLVQAEEEARRYQQELTIAASIQQRLMEVKIPEVPFARLRGKNLSCKEIGGDFFDAVNAKEGLAVVLADVSGKGVSAALLASTLQGMIYSHLSSGMPLLDVVAAVNHFFTEKLVGEKYATVLLARLRRDGDLEYVNCGHVQPLLICGGEVMRPPHGNVPVGLLADATFESARCQLNSGDRFILVTDGVTEAENAMGDFFEDSR